MVVVMLGFCMLAAGALACGDCGTCDELASITFDVVRSSISADTLVNLKNSGISMALLEYRAKSQSSDIAIPDSIVVYEDVSTEGLKKMLDKAWDLIVVFPGVEGANVASLTEKIREIGFNSVLEFEDGVQGWLTYGYEWIENK